MTDRQTVINTSTTLFIARMYVCVCVCMYVCVCIYAHKHTHTHIFRLGEGGYVGCLNEYMVSQLSLMSYSDLWRKTLHVRVCFNTVLPLQSLLLLLINSGVLRE
jgi:hypothetical protein